MTRLIFQRQYNILIMSTGQSTIFVQTEIFQQLVDGLQCNFAQIFMFPRGLSLLTGDSLTFLCLAQSTTGPHCRLTQELDCRGAVSLDFTFHFYLEWDKTHALLVANWFTSFTLHPVQSDWTLTCKNAKLSNVQPVWERAWDWEGIIVSCFTASLSNTKHSRGMLFGCTSTRNVVVSQTSFNRIHASHANFALGKSCLSVASPVGQ